MTDKMRDKEIVCAALCRNNWSGYGAVCADACNDFTVPGQPHPCEHAVVVWGSDAQEILAAISTKQEAGEECGAAAFPAWAAVRMLECLIDPTEEMIDAGRAATAAHLDIQGSALTVSREKMRRRFNAMIRHALANKPPEAGEVSRSQTAAPFAGRQSFPAALQDWLADIEEYLQDQHDIRDGAGGQQLPNKAMSLSIALKEALGERP